ncbi:hypothetical protein [Limosilactobacillus coleohominis]|uniref:hypothetical protein n=1 Tax=Limosilactobacillus coleohominis TaxID=181675 RepID=UPI002A91CAA2|nr:hypothetical protein [Limosilactobacillus coleohominis]MDY5629021.1 hypothetical protein [Limosilactobacillus coleohominis]
MNKVKFSDIVSDVATVKGLPIDTRYVKGFPRVGVELSGEVKKTPYREYDNNGNLIDGSVDTTRITKLQFRGYNLRQVNREREDLANGDITRDEYDDNIADLSELKIVINGEENCNEFMNRYGKIIDGLDAGNAYDCDASHLVIIPVWSQSGWPKLICSFDDLTSLKFSQFDFATLGGGSNGAKA